MLFATYQPNPNNTTVVDRNEEKWAYLKFVCGFEPYWAMPVTSVADFFCHSIFTAPNCGEVIYFVESEDYVRIDKVKHYQKIKDENSFDLTGCVNPNLDDKHSEFLIPNIENPIAAIPIAGLETLVSSPFFNFSVKERKFTQDLNNVIRSALQRYINMETRRPSWFSSDAEWAESMDMTVPEFNRRMYLEKNKMAFESVLLPFVVKQVMGDVVSEYDVEAIQHHFDKQRQLYLSFSQWSYNDCSLEQYDKFYDQMRDLVIDNSAVCAVLVNHQKPGRNDMCPCGSGRKWKKCHGLFI